MKFALGGIVLATSLALTAAPSVAQGRWVELGMTLSGVQSVYPTAKPRAVGGARVLEMKDMDFGGAHWQTVDFIFGPAGRLDRVQLMTRSQSFDQVKTQLYAAADAADQGAPAPGESEPIMDFDSSIQVRICDRGGAGVYLTYERPSEAI